MAAAWLWALGPEADAQQCPGDDPELYGCWSQRYCPLSDCPGTCDNNSDTTVHAALVGAGASVGNQGSVLIWRGNYPVGYCPNCGPDVYHIVHRWKAEYPQRLPAIDRAVDGTHPTLEPETTVGYNIFCSHHTFDANGRLVIAGAIGHSCCDDGPDGEPGDSVWRYGFVLDTSLNLFNAAVDPWIGPLDADPTFGWFYPTCITLGDGRILTAGGSSAGWNPSITSCDSQENPLNCKPRPDDYFSDEVNLFDPETDSWSGPLPSTGLAGHETTLTIYPHLFQLKSGLVFLAHIHSNDFKYNDPPEGEIREDRSFTFDPSGPPNTGWVARDRNTGAFRAYSTSAYLPRMTPEADEGVVLIGGADPDTNPQGLAAR